MADFVPGTDEVLVRREGVAGRLSLNRPGALHALTHDMCRAMSAALRRWRDDPAVRVVVIDHATGRGFCAGGDIRRLHHSALSDGGVAGRAFFFDEYRLNHQLFTYPKPVVSLMDGITMGGGVGISQPARFRVATQHCRLAMPESGIGLFPDVGGGWYLSRLPGRIGPYLALVGARLDGAECLWAGLASHYLPAAALPGLRARLAAGEMATAVLADLGAAAPAPALAAHAPRIARHFAFDRLEDILASLASDPDDWARTTHDLLRARSPLSCKVALRQLQCSLRLPDFAANMAMEYRIASRMLGLPDFAEGVRAAILDRDNRPQWQPARPEEVTKTRLDALFAPLPPEEEWTPL